MGIESELTINTKAISVVEQAIIGRLGYYFEDEKKPRDSVVYHGATDQPEVIRERMLELTEREKLNILIRPSCVKPDWDTSLYLISINLSGEAIRHVITFISSQEERGVDFAILNGIHVQVEAVQKERWEKRY